MRSFIMKSWNNHKRSGNFRRKVDLTLRKYKELCDKSAPSNSTRNPSPCPLIQSEEFVETVMPTELSYEGENVEVQDLRTSWLSELEPHELSDSEKDIIMKIDVQQWALKNRITHQALNQLMGIINKRLPNVFPQDARTLLSTPKNIVIKPLENGQYWRNGVENCLN